MRLLTSFIETSVLNRDFNIREPVPLRGIRAIGLPYPEISDRSPKKNLSDRSNPIGSRGS
jgi:hypothetical protein